MTYMLMYPSRDARILRPLTHFYVWTCAGIMTSLTVFIGNYGTVSVGGKLWGCLEKILGSIVYCACFESSVSARGVFFITLQPQGMLSVGRWTGTSETPSSSWRVRSRDCRCAGTRSESFIQSLHHRVHFL